MSKEQIAPALPSVTSVTPSVANLPLTVRVFVVFSWLLGWWLTFDGLHQRLLGDYVRINGQLGPWADLVRAVGVDPHSLGWLFVVLGLDLIAASFGVILRRRWGYNVALGASALCLLYLGFGTPVALICLIALLLPPSRAYMQRSEASSQSSVVSSQ